VYPLWNKVVEPALRAAGAKRVVEIGALRGDTTVLLLDLLGPQAELHVIDPLPSFDPEEHSKRFPGRYVFHRDISHNVLPDLPAVDAALVDGDHNWYTVYHELRMLRETAEREDHLLPLIVMHDVRWPYGRRDLYYEPDRIPDEFRQPYARRGLLPGRSELCETEGLNPHLANALEEGGPRNGVLTALDDFVAEYDGGLRVVLLPLYFGMAVVADEKLLAARPELAEVLDHLESAEGRYDLVELGESIRIDEQVEFHNLHHRRGRQAPGAAWRYLDLVKSTVLDEHYLENEVRIQHLMASVMGVKTLSRRGLRDPGRYLTEEVRKLEQERRAGELPTASSNGDAHNALALTQVGRTRLDHLEECLDTIREAAVPGDLLDCGTGRGGTSIFMAAYLAGHEVFGRRLWVADRFGGGAPPDEDGPAWFAPDLNTVREGFQRFGLLGDDVRFLQGAPSETLAEAPVEDIALLRIDRQDPQEVSAILATAYDKVSPGGFVVIDDYGSEGCAEAVQAFRAERGIAGELQRIDWSGSYWRKTEGEAPRASAPPQPPVTRDLSLTVLVVFHNMQREAARTLHSLTRAYQRDIENLDYEVIVIDNGSTPEGRLGEDFVKSFGSEFSYLDLGEQSSPSPAHALNKGLEVARGRSVAVMIDGAHVLTPGALHFGMLGLTTYSPAVVSIQQWYVGPGEQNEAVAKGYDEGYEDQLFEQIEWPVDGYRLFDIGHFIGGRDWFDGQWESNCVFVPASLLDQVGAMDHSFNAPGGGFANLDFFERMTTSPNINLVTVLGEGSFHQVHGGTTTNAPESGERRELLQTYGDQYAEIRGNVFKSPAKIAHYVGALPEAARRTKARRMGAPIYFKLAHVEGTDGRPPQPVPVPEELRTEFVDAFWRSKEWQQTPWLGKWTARPPTDLVAYQELIARVRPDWIIETGTGGGGRAYFLATICDLLDHGRIVSIDDYPVRKLVEHPRIEYVRQSPAEPDAAAAVRELTGEQPKALMILAAGKLSQLSALYDHYGALVPVGSYIVLEDTILNGHPVWTGFGPGPWEAARQILDGGEFERDLSLERYALTFNAGGFLKRVKEPGT
jgi:cephalosporin hydroxylase